MMSHGEMTWADGLIPMIEPEVVAGIISRVSDIALVVSEAGVIKGFLSNPVSAIKADLKEWLDRPVQDMLTLESVPKFDARLEQFLSGSGSGNPVELNHKATAQHAEFPMRYSFHPSGKDNTILMLGSDLSLTAAMQQQLVAAQIALENDYEAQREYDLRFRVLMESSDTPTVFVSVKTGHMVNCNAAAEMLLGKPREALIDASFGLAFETGGRRDVVDRLVSAASEQTVSPIVVKSSKDARKLSLVPTLYRGTDGQMLLCKINVAGEQTRAGDQLQTQLLDLYENGVDSIVFVSDAGLILSSNDAFLKLADVTHSQSIKGRPMVDFFSRGAVDLNVMLENARRTGSMRLYATKVISEHGGERAVEISTTQLSAGNARIFAMVMRDSRRVETVQTPMQQITDVDMPSVIELIGGHSLKDIVAKSTDVVERMCIETAVKMTSNNRVAAAEMLGLSRQSLYVKLRKYGLVNKT